MPSVQPTLFEFMQGKESREQIIEQTGPHGRILQGHVIDVLKELPSESVHCVVTSPPYWGLRDYGLPPTVWDGEANCKHEWMENWTGKVQVYKTGTGRKPREPNLQDSIRTCERRHQGDTCSLCDAWRGSLGLEPTPELYTQHLVQVFQEVKRILRPDGTLWLNMGDTYHGSWGGVSHDLEKKAKRMGYNTRPPSSYPITGLKAKDLVGVPWMVAFALRTDGWYLHSDIIWSKPNPMPESVSNRPTKSHEYLFLFAKNGEPIYWVHPTKGGARDRPEPDYRWENLTLLHYRVVNV